LFWFASACEHENGVDVCLYKPVIAGSAETSQ